MDAIQLLSVFFAAIADDHRIRSTHIAVFSALLQYRITNGSNNPIKVYSRDMMGVAKISKPSTYCKCVSELDEYGYILYRPSYKKNQASLIYFKDAEPIF